MPPYISLQILHGSRDRCALHLVAIGPIDNNLHPLLSPTSHYAIPPPSYNTRAKLVSKSAFSLSHRVPTILHILLIPILLIPNLASHDIAYPRLPHTTHPIHHENALKSTSPNFQSPSIVRTPQGCANPPSYCPTKTC